MKFKNIYMKLISGGMIGNSICIGIIFNGLIQELKLKGKNPIKFCQKYYLNKNERTSHWVGHSDLKELGTIDFFKRKQMIYYMEAELTKAS